MKISISGMAALVLAVCFFSLEAVASISLTTTFASNNSQSGNMFDVVTLSNSLTVESFDLNLAAGTWTIELYKKSGTYDGFENTPGAWTFVDSKVVNSNGVNNASPFNPLDFGLPANSTTGIYITTTVANAGLMNYTNGSGVGNVAASNANLKILEGAGISYAFSSTFEPRIWNGTIYYSVASQATVPEPLSVMVWVGLTFATITFGNRRTFSRN